MVLSVCRNNVVNKGIKLEAEHGKYAPELIYFDKSRVTQVVMNLVGNAAKFTPKGGKITVKTQWFWKCDHSNGDCESCNGWISPIKRKETKKLENFDLLTLPVFFLILLHIIDFT